MVRAMTDGQLVALEDGTKAKVKQVQISTWQTLLVAVEEPPKVDAQKR